MGDAVQLGKMQSEAIVSVKKVTFLFAKRVQKVTVGSPGAFILSQV